ncbi:MAG: molybdopterin biosynthesis protein [Bacillota bacterium]
MKKRNVYLKGVPLQEARDKFFEGLAVFREELRMEGEPIPVDVGALSRITAEPVFAKLSQPAYHSCAMDGIATRSHLTFGASETNPRRLRLGEEAVYVDTGDPLPRGFDSVIMVEDLIETTPLEVAIISPARPWQHVRTVGEDIVATELVLPENHKIRAFDLGALLAAGVTQVMVRRKPKVAIIPTGDELILPGTTPEVGDITEFNSRLIGGLVQEWGGEPIFWDIVPDEPQALTEAVVKASLSADIIVVNAGSSAGSEDYTSDIVKSLGELFVHGVAIKPGKPTILGIVDKKPFFGIPGYPVSAALSCELFLLPLLTKMLGQTVKERTMINATLARRIVSVPGMDEFIRVKVGKVGGRYVASPLARGAGAIMSLVRADGYIEIPGSSQGIQESSEVAVHLLRDAEEIDNAVVAIGSHDLALDLLGSLLSGKYPGMSLSSTHVGSMGGIMAMRRGEAHIAGVHLLDEETGEYNVPYVKRYLDSKDYALVNLVHREQGLIVAPGNPKGIQGISDLVKPGVSFVNRQRGAGTRILLDLELKKLGISEDQISGYEHEEYTHMGVAASVANSVADVGLGIRSAARALGLDFVPVAWERYDLLMTKEFLHSSLMDKLLSIISSSEFKGQVESLGGYDLSQSGRVVWQG